MRHYLWLDFETLGTDPRSQVIEVGAIVTDDIDMRELSRFSAVIGTADSEWANVDPVVLAMHSGSQLKDLSLRADATAPVVAARMASWLKPYAAEDELVLAGGGVASFDRQIIKLQPEWASVDRLLTYWCLDVSNLRRALEAMGFAFEATDPKPHRSMGDTELALAEYLRLQKWLVDVARDAVAEVDR